jgi:hypothetical protein
MPFSMECEKLFAKSCPVSPKAFHTLLYSFSFLSLRLEWIQRSCLQVINYFLLTYSLIETINCTFYSIYSSLQFKIYVCYFYFVYFYVCGIENLTLGFSHARQANSCWTIFQCICLLFKYSTLYWVKFLRLRIVLISLNCITGFTEVSLSFLSVIWLLLQEDPHNYMCSLVVVSGILGV